MYLYIDVCILFIGTKVKCKSCTVHLILSQKIYLKFELT